MANPTPDTLGASEAVWTHWEGTVTKPLACVSAQTRVVLTGVMGLRDTRDRAAVERALLLLKQRLADLEYAIAGAPC